jgi:hypothetical protein
MNSPGSIITVLSARRDIANPSSPLLLNTSERRLIPVVPNILARGGGRDALRDLAPKGRQHDLHHQGAEAIRTQVPGGQRQREYLDARGGNFRNPAVI